MSHHWLIITISWLGTASLQYINTGGPGADSTLDAYDSILQYPLPYANYFSLPSSANEYYNAPEEANDQYYPHEEVRKRRTADAKDHSNDRQWITNPVDIDKTLYLDNQGQGSPFVIGFTGNFDDNETEFRQMEKKSFSPWGGKRDKPSIEHMWSWKRGSALREPNMPKRVRFSPWGGKRSGQMIYKPGTKASKIIFSTSIPELTKIVSNYSPLGDKISLSGFQFIPSIDKRHPIKILALSTNADEKTLREALPFKNFIDSLPDIFRTGHPYLDVNLKKDGKRKVKFSAWGGKRTPPIIGPIWTPAPEEVKDSTLETILLLRNDQDKKEHTAKSL